MEYALLVSALAAVIAVAVFAIGRVTASQFSRGVPCLTSSGKDGGKDEAGSGGKDD